MYTERLKQVIEYAENYARENKYGSIDTRHLLVGLTAVESDAKKYLADFGITRESLKYTSDNAGYGSLLRKKEYDYALNRSATICNALKDEQVDCVHLLLAILSDKDCYAYGTLNFRLGEERRADISLLYGYVLSKMPGKENLIKYILSEGPKETLQEQENDDVRPSAATFNSRAYHFDKADDSEKKEEQQEIPFGTDLTQRAREGKFDPVIGRDEEIRRIVQILSRRNKNNPVLVGEPGVGKSAVIEGLAQAIADGDVPPMLIGKRLVQLDIAGMVAGARYRGDFEERLKNVIEKVTSCGDVIIFIDEIHNIVGAGSSADGSMDAAEIMKPVLARGQLQTVGATTLDEYRKYIEKDPALERRFQPVTVAEPTAEQAIAILKGVKGKYEQHHEVKIPDSAIEAAVRLSVRYINDRFLPDKAFDLLDEACSKVRIGSMSAPEPLRRAAQQVAAARRQRDELMQNSADVNAIAAQTEVLNRQIRNYESILAAANAARRDKSVTAEDVAQVVAQWTGIPVTQLTQSEKDRLLNLEATLGKRVIGQNEAVRAVSLAVRRQRAGLKDPNRPIGSFIFVGPTGVGKTELTKALAECLFGSSNAVVRLDMSEYMEKQSVSKLIGAPPGYVGFEETGLLTEKVRRRPYCVVLFDEMEKAHPDVFNLLLQILDEGRLTDSHGKVVDFRNTVIIFTSNAGSDVRVNKGLSEEAAAQRSMDALRRFFRPEFLNRIDEIVPFKPLGQEEILAVTRLLCKSLRERLKDTVDLRFTSDSLLLLSQMGYDAEYGARPLKRLIQRKIEDVLAEKLLSGEVQQGDYVAVDVGNSDIVLIVQPKQ